MARNQARNRIVSLLARELDVDTNMDTTAIGV
jgi:hypothetical protein